MPLLYVVVGDLAEIAEVEKIVESFLGRGGWNGERREVRSVGIIGEAIRGYLSLLSAFPPSLSHESVPPASGGAETHEVLALEYQPNRPSVSSIVTSYF